MTIKQNLTQILTITSTVTSNIQCDHFHITTKSSDIKLPPLDRNHFLTIIATSMKPTVNHLLLAM